MGSRWLGELTDTSHTHTMDASNSTALDMVIDVFDDLNSLDELFAEDRADSIDPSWDDAVILILSVSIVFLLVLLLATYLHRRRKSAEDKVIEGKTKDIVINMEDGLGDQLGLHNQNYLMLLEPTSSSSSTYSPKTSISTSPSTCPSIASSSPPSTHRTIHSAV